MRAACIKCRCLPLQTRLRNARFRSFGAFRRAPERRLHGWARSAKIGSLSYANRDAKSARTMRLAISSLRLSRDTCKASLAHEVRPSTRHTSVRRLRRARAIPRWRLALLPHLRSCSSHRHHLHHRYWHCSRRRGTRLRRRRRYRRNGRCKNKFPVLVSSLLWQYTTFRVHNVPIAHCALSSRGIKLPRQDILYG